METKLTVEGVELEVEFSSYAGSRGARDSLGGVANAGPPLVPGEISMSPILGKGQRLAGMVRFLPARTDL